MKDYVINLTDAPKGYAAAVKRWMTEHSHPLVEVHTNVANRIHLARLNRHLIGAIVQKKTFDETTQNLTLTLVPSGPRAEVTRTVFESNLPSKLSARYVLDLESQSVDKILCFDLIEP